jgi:two-component system, NtrC family, nitrogen regulation sensor histidine kinase NtrY
VARDSRPRFVAAALVGPLLAALIAYLGATGRAGAGLWVFAAAGAVLWIVLLLRLRRFGASSLQVLSNALGSLREGDYSVRLGERPGGDPLREVFAEVNRLGERLRERRLTDLEAALLLQTVVAEMDVAILALDEQGVVRVANPASASLLGRRQAQLVGSSAAALGIGSWLEGAAPRTVTAKLPGGHGPWELRRQIFRQEGKRHVLMVLADLGRALREEERQVWQRLIRVMGHEVNNSLTPIRSIAGTLTDMLGDVAVPDDWRQEMREGLVVVAGRAGSLSRFIGSYARLAQLPPPRPAPVEVAPWVARVARLEVRRSVEVQDGPAVRLLADADQLDQLLINLIRNAVDAVQDGEGRVTIRWLLVDERLQLEVLDEGPGLSAEANLFVPFFTTKAGGSGIGLVLCRQIAEAHGGTLTLGNRSDRQGCVATLAMPLRTEIAA